MKRIIAAVTAIVAVLFFAYSYRLEALGILQTDVEVIADRNVARTLMQGEDPETAQPVALKSFRAADAIYSRGSSLYLGENKTRVESGYPFFVNHGTALWYFTETGSLVTDDFMDYEPYRGLFISDGMAFDENGISQDEDIYIFARLANGLYINTVPVVVDRFGVRQEIRMNSVIRFEQNGFRYYSYDEDTLVYDEADISSDAQIMIRDHSYSYRDFLRLLGVVKDAGGVTPTPEQLGIQASLQDENRQPVPEKEGVSAQETAALSDDAAAEGSAEAGEAFNGRGEESSADESRAQQSAAARQNDIGYDSSKAANTSAEKDTLLSERGESGLSGDELGEDGFGGGDSIFSDGFGSGDSFGGGYNSGDGGSGSSGSSGSDGSSGSSASAGIGNSGTGNNGSNSGDNGQGTVDTEGGNDDGNQGSQDSSAGEHGSSKPGNAGGSGNGDGNADGGSGDTGDSPGQEIPGEGDGGSGTPGTIVKPTVSIGAVTTGVYSLNTKLTIADEDNRLKRVVLRVYEDKGGGERGEQITRRNFKRAGDITVGNITPGSDILLEGWFVWLDSGGNKVTEPFMEPVSLKTLPIAGNVKPIAVSFTEQTEYLERQLRIPGLALSSEDDASLTYISRISLKTAKEGETGESSVNFGSSDVQQLKSKRTVEWTSDASYSSGSAYNWQMVLSDQFGNQLPTVPELIKGTSKTSYIAPSASISLSVNGVGEQTVNIMITNPDASHVHLTNCYVEVWDTTVGSPVMAFPGNDDTSEYRKTISGASGTQQVTLQGLPSGKNYQIRVYGTYNTQDNAAGEATVDGLLGQTTVYTAPLSNLGYAFLSMSAKDLSSSGGTVRANITASTNSLLVELLSEITLTLSGAKTGDISFTVDKAAWDRPIAGLSRTDDGAYQLTAASKLSGTPEIALVIPDGADIDLSAVTVWEAVQQYYPLEFRFPEGKFASATSYTASFTLYASQGGERYSVGAESNVVTFRTLRQAPVFEHGDFLVLSDFAELHDFIIHDPDGAVPDGRVSMRLYANNRLVEQRTLRTNRLYSEKDGTLLSFSNLSAQTDYQLRFVCEGYNEAYTPATLQSNYEFPTVYSFTTGAGISGKLEIRSLTQNTSGGFDVTLRVILADNNNDMIDDPAYTLEFKGAEGINISENDLTEDGWQQPETYKIEVKDGATQDVQRDFTYEIDSYHTYQASLVIQVKDYTVTLDTVSFETGEELYTISTVNDFNKLNDHPEGKFIVLNDIDFGTVTTSYNASKRFDGILDFQGYTITRNTPNWLLGYIGSDGIVKNLVLEWNPTLSGAVQEKSALVYRNYGTIQNVIVRVNVSGRYKSTMGGIVYNNYANAVIENFIVNFESDCYVGGSFGGATYSNSGIVRNGYVYGSDLIVGSGVYGGDGGNGSRGSAGGIVGSNAADGSVYNVFSLIDVSVEKSTSMGSISPGVGYNSGQVRQIFTSGDLYSYEFDENKKQKEREIYEAGGVTVGSTAAANVKENYYYSERGIQYKKNYENPIQVQILRSPGWYEALINDESAFMIAEMVSAGFYPKLILPDSMMAEQENINLPVFSLTGYPDLISASVTEEGTDENGGDYAVLDLEFYNTNNYFIAGLDIQGLTVEILEGQGATENNYHVSIKVTNPTAYQSVYTVSKVYYKASASAITTYNMEYTGRTVNVKFYKPIYTVEDWSTIKNDLTGNYRLMNDLDFGAPGVYMNDVRIDSSTGFSGELDGNDRTISNVRQTSNGVLISVLNGGSIHDLTIEGLRLETVPTLQTSASKTGLIGEMKNNAALKNVHILGTEDCQTVEICAYGGALTGYLTNSVVEDCSVSNMHLQTTAYQKNSLYVGGMIGYATVATIDHCYVNGIVITAEEGAASSGIGGMVGMLSVGSTLQQAYAAGEITSSFQNVGGLAGSAASAVKNVWTSVSISGISDNMGGIIGRITADMNVNNVVAVGDCYTTASSLTNVNRIVGGTAGKLLTKKNTCGYFGQIIGQAASAEEKGASRVLQISELWTRQAYRDYALLGAAFDLSGHYYAAEDGYLPMLYGSDGELLPYQQPVLLPDPNLGMKIAGVSDDGTGSGIYTIIVEVSHSGYKLGELTGAGLTLVQTKIQEIRDGYTQLTYEATPIQYKDSYQLQMRLVKEGTENAGQTVSAVLDKPMSRIIHNAQEWMTLMSEYGTSYENFELAGDVDLTGLSAPVNLKINRIKGNGHTVSGFEYTLQANSESMIAVLAGTMENITFADCKLDGSARTGGSNVGLIGVNQGQLTDVAFKNITIYAGAAANAGCVGFNKGTIQGCDLTDIKLTGTGNYYGGLVGYSQGEIHDIRAVGTEKDGYLLRNPANAKGSYTGGIIGYQTQAIAQDLTAAGVGVYGQANTGGLVGDMVGLSSVPTVYRYRLGYTRDDDGAIHEYDTVRNAVGGTQYVGGAFGRVEGTGNPKYYLDVYNTDITGSSSNIGGVSGYEGWTYGYCITVKDVAINAGTGGENHGGVYGYGGMCQRARVEKLTLKGTKNVGGVCGKPFGSVSYVVVTDSDISGGSYVGGINGTYNRYEQVQRCGVYSTKISGSQYAGGINGISYGNNFMNNYVASCTISGGSFVGGFSGEIYSGRYYNNAISADVTATSQNAGMLAGTVRSYYQGDSWTISYPATQVFQNYFAGTVEAQEYAAGMIGLFKQGEDVRDSNGAVVTVTPRDMEGSRFNKNLVAVSKVTAGMSDRGAYIAYTQIYTGDGDTKGGKDSGQMNDSYIWNGMQLTASSGSEGVRADSVEAFKLGTNGVRLVDTAALKTSGHYSYLSTYFDPSEAADGTMPYVKNTAWEGSAGGTNTEPTTNAMKELGHKIPVPDGYQNLTTTAAIFALPGVSIYSSGVDRVNVEMDAELAALSLNGAEAQDETWDTGITLMSLNDEENAEITAMLLNDEENAEITAMSLNDEENAESAVLPSDGEAAAYTLTVKAGNRTLVSVPLTQRVMTLSYDYQTPMTVEISNGTDTASAEIEPEMLAHSVSVDGGSYYYLTQGGVGTPDGLEEGEYIHLYQGYALDLDGNVTDLNGGDGTETAAEVGGTELLDTTPLYQWDYAGYMLDVFQGFTYSFDNEAVEAAYYMDSETSMAETTERDLTDREPAVLDYQVIVKNHDLTLFDASNPVSSDGWIIDHYQNADFITVLGDDGKLCDIGSDEITMPEGFVNAGIAEISNTATADEPIVLGRYTTGKVFGFNYLTGEELELINNEEQEISLMQYAENWISEKKDSLLKPARSSYLAAEQFANGVDLGEIDRLYAEASGQDSIANVLRGHAAGGTGGTDGSGSGKTASPDAAGNVDKQLSNSSGSEGASQGGGSQSDTDNKAVGGEGSTALTSGGSNTGGSNISGGEKAGSSEGTEAKKAVSTAERKQASDNSETEKKGTGLQKEDEEDTDSVSKHADSHSDEEKQKDSAADVSDENAETTEKTNRTDTNVSRTEKESAEGGTAAAGEKNGTDSTDVTAEHVSAEHEAAKDEAAKYGTAEYETAEHEAAEGAGSAASVGKVGAANAETANTETANTGAANTETAVKASDNQTSDDSTSGSDEEKTSGKSDRESNAADEAAVSGNDGTGGSGNSAGSDGSSVSGNAAVTSEGISEGAAEAGVRDSSARSSISARSTAVSRSTLDSTWLPVYDSATGKYQLYNAGELLSGKNGKTLSVDQKIEELKLQGINMTAAQAQQNLALSEEGKQGMAIYIITSLGILLLLGNLWFRRRRFR